MLKTDPSVRPYSRCISITCISLTVHVTVCVAFLEWFHMCTMLSVLTECSCYRVSVRFVPMITVSNHIVCVFEEFSDDESSCEEFDFGDEELENSVDEQIVTPTRRNKVDQ